MRYTVVFTSKSHFFYNQVEHHLQEGWRYVGGVSICVDDKGTIHFAQAMEREEKDGKPQS